MQNTSLIENAFDGIWVSIGLAIVGLMFILLIFRNLLRSDKHESSQVAVWLYSAMEATFHLGPGPNSATDLSVKQIPELWRRYLDARNDRYRHFVTATMAVFLALTIAVLMVFRVISAEAGLPLIAAVGSYVLGNGSLGRGNSGNPSADGSNPGGLGGSDKSPRG